MSQFITEAKRFQKLAGIINENEDQNVNQAEVVANKVENSLEAKVDKLSPEQIQQLQAELTKMGVTAETPVDSIAKKVETSLDEVEGDDKQKLASTLSNIGTGLVGSLLVPIIPVAIGHSTGLGTAAGIGITLGAAALLKGLALALKNKKA
jgi:VIT1/CCC1 family predicted Fe2+/Mn2+ transporter